MEHARQNLSPYFAATLGDLLESQKAAIILRCIAGSRAYGTVTPQSDTDIRGVFVLPAAAYRRLQPPLEQLSDAQNNETYYALRRFIELTAAANPNFLELLFVPEDCLLEVSPVGRRLIETREIFLSQRAYASHVAYAQAQIKRARGQNKWVNNPQPELPPGKEAFCWFIARNESDQALEAAPLRPRRLADAGVVLTECHAAALEHAPGMYRLYHYGPSARGVFRGGNLVCESIPLADESSRCIGLLIFNESAHERAVKDHRHYWQWRTARNESRWLAQEGGKIDYDAKNLMHTFRLLYSVRHLFSAGLPRVRFTGRDLAELLRIRAGAYAYDALISRAEELVVEVDTLRAQSPLPAEPDAAALDLLFEELSTMWEREHE